jgi:hypothetical protein
MKRSVRNSVLLTLISLVIFGGLSVPWRHVVCRIEVTGLPAFNYP